MDKENRVMSPGAVVAAARPRPPSPDAQRQDGRTVEVLPDHDGLRVLVADDDADTADSLAMLLSFWGHECWVAYSGSEALAMAISTPGQVGDQVSKLYESFPYPAHGIISSVLP